MPGSLDRLLAIDIDVRWYRKDPLDHSSLLRLAHAAGTWLEDPVRCLTVHVAACRFVLDVCGISRHPLKDKAVFIIVHTKEMF